MKVEFNQSVSGSVSIEAINTLGIVQEKFDQKIDAANSILFNTASLNPGVYLLVIRFDSQIITGTFIKE